MIFVSLKLNIESGPYRFRGRVKFQFVPIIVLEEIGINAGNWVDSAQDRNYWRAFVNAALDLRVS